MLQYPNEQRRGYLFNKFNAISSQAQYPIRFDNERKWIRYYDKINNNRKKYRFNRYSLNMLDGSTMTGSMGLPSSQSFVSSPHIVENKMALTHSTFFHWFFVMFHYHFNKDRSNHFNSVLWFFSVSSWSAFFLEFHRIYDENSSWIIFQTIHFFLHCYILSSFYPFHLIFLELCHEFFQFWLFSLFQRLLHLKTEKVDCIYQRGRDYFSMYPGWLCRFSHFLLTQHFSTGHIEWPFRVNSSWPFFCNLPFGTIGKSFLHLFDLINFLSIIKHHKFSMFFDEIGVFGYSGWRIFDDALDKFPVVESFWRLRLTAKFYFWVYSRSYHFIY